MGGTRSTALGMAGDMSSHRHRHPADDDTNYERILSTFLRHRQSLGMFLPPSVVRRRLAAAVALFVPLHYPSLPARLQGACLILSRSTNPVLLKG